MFFEDVDDGCWVSYVVIGVEFEFFELRIFADQILDGPLDHADEALQCLTIWPLGFQHVSNGVYAQTFFRGDRRGIDRGASIGVVINGHVGTAGANRFGWSGACGGRRGCRVSRFHSHPRSVATAPASKYSSVPRFRTLVPRLLRDCNRELLGDR